MGFVLTFGVEVVDGIAICNYQSVVAPLVSQYVDKQSVACATRLTLESLIGAHHLAHITFLNQGLECWQICLP